MNKKIQRATWEDTVMYSEKPRTFKRQLAESILGTLLGLFIIALVGSAIWGNEGFVELLASFF
jgi:hypothetical protein